MKTNKRILTGIAILLLFPVVAFAQINVSSTPTTTVISTGRAEVAGDIVFTAGPSGAVSDTITINYNSLPITNITNGKTGITVTGSGSGSFSAPTFTVNNAKGTLEVKATGGTAAAAGNTITLTGVRVSVDGSGLSSVKATVSTVANPLFVGGLAGAEVTVISALVAGIAEVKSVTKTIIMGTTGTTIAGTTGEISIKEGFKDAFKTTAQAGASASQGTQIRITATGIPAKATVDLTAPTSTSLSPVQLKPKDTGTENESTLTFTATDATKVETLSLTYTVGVSKSTKPIAAGDITLTFTLAPIEAVFTASADLAKNTSQPKFAQADLSAVAAAVAPGTTNLYLPLITWVAGFDTGIQVSNTTADPFASGESAVKQSGTITFHFFPNDGTASFSYTTTTDSPGSGLTAGAVAAGGTYTVLASEVLKAAGRTTSFTGYGIAVTQFTHAHGNTFVSNFTSFTQGVPALVMKPTGLDPRALQSVEQLQP